MKYILTFLLITLNTMTYSQVVLLDESFDDELPESWSHCSGNWGEFAQWKTEDGLLKESSGPYFVRVLNGILLPSINFDGITNTMLEFEYALGEIDTTTRLSIYYTSSDSCSTVWDTVNIGYLLENWNLIADLNKTNEINNNDWVPSDDDFETVQIALDSFVMDSTFRIGIVADYNNTFASGKYYIKNVKVVGTSTTHTIESSIEDASIDLFPNPAYQTVSVILKDAQGPTNLQIINTSGQLVYSTQSTRRRVEIDVSDYAKGMYMLQCTVSGKLVTKKFIVE